MKKMQLMAEGLIYKIGAVDRFRNNIAGKNVLVLGSGPSASEVQWASEDWDVLITTSFFYLNNEVCNKKPIHVSLSKLVDLDDPRLNEFLIKNPMCTISFEPKIEKYFPINSMISTDDAFKACTKTHRFYAGPSFRRFYRDYADRIIFYRVHGGLEGLAGRLCWMAIDSMASKILVCGLDGVSQNRIADPKNYFRSHIGTTDKYTFEEYRDSFVGFAENLYSTAKNLSIKVENLGIGKPYNLMSEVSEKYEI